MFLRPLLVSVGFVVALTAVAQPADRERNFWPVRVNQVDELGQTYEWQGAGPLVFRKLLPGQRTATGVRPFYLRKDDVEPGHYEKTVLYPLFTYRRDNETYRWSIFSLVNRTGPRDAAPISPTSSVYRGFDVWPFYFSRDTGSPDTSYRALFPIYGTVHNRLFNEKASWVVFPVYLRTENRGVVATSVLWPFFRKIEGNGFSGFQFWPLFGWRGKPGVAHSQFYLWPLIYKAQAGLDQPRPAESIGFLPFYSRDRAEGYLNKTYLWPFFGYSDRTVPYRYHETRYLWPFFVQGRGDDRYRNRWAPFYTHSVIKGIDKRWFAWPLVRNETWTEQGLRQEKTQFLYFIYWSLRQESATNPNLAPAEKSHLWPLYSKWDNGAGRQQFQLLSPFEVFLPNNENARLLWTPLFSLYRSDRQAAGNTRYSMLFDLVTWRRDPGHREFHLGPLLGVTSSPSARRVALAGGLLGFRRSATAGWRPFWFDFRPHPNQPVAASR